MKIIKNLLERIRALCYKLQDYALADEAGCNEIEELCGGECSIEKYVILTYIIEDFDEKPEVIVRLLAERYGLAISEEDRQLLKDSEEF